MSKTMRTRSKLFPADLRAELGSASDLHGVNEQAHEETVGHILGNYRSNGLVSDVRVEGVTDGQALIYDEDGASATEGLWVPGDDPSGTHSDGGFKPSDYGWLAWTFDPIQATASSILGPYGAGLLTAQLFKAHHSGTVGNVVFYCTLGDGSQGATYIAVYDELGVQLGETASIAAQLASSNEVRSKAFGSSFEITKGEFYYIATIVDKDVGASDDDAQISARVENSMKAVNVGVTLGPGEGYRIGHLAAPGLDDPPASFDPGDLVGNTSGEASTHHWFALKE